MKGTLTDEERERLMAEANEKAERDRGHDWWVKMTTPQRKIILKREVRDIIQGASP